MAPVTVGESAGASDPTSGPRVPWAPSAAAAGRMPGASSVAPATSDAPRRTAAGDAPGWSGRG
jgi:hypothetical protein